MKTQINVILAAIGATISYFLGGWDASTQILVTALVLDYISGLAKAYVIEKEVSSKTGVKGIIKKVGYLIVVAVAVLADKILGNTGAIRTLVIYFFVANEGISILENWGGMGLPLPPKLMDALVQIRNKESE